MIAPRWPQLVLVAISLAGSLAVGEVAYRVLLRARYRSSLAGVANSDWRMLPGDERVFQLRPNHAGHGPFGNDTRRSFNYRTNADGLRGPEVGPKRPGRVRVLVLGDSYTFGWAVGAEETYAARAQALLGERAEVINGGVPGYNTEQEYALLRVLADRYRPDAVVVGYVMNDAEPQGNVPAAPEATYRMAASWAWEDIKVFLNSLLGRPAFEMRKLVHDYDYLTGFRSDSPKQRAAQNALAGMARYCRSRGVALLLLVLPDVSRPLDEHYPLGAIHAVVLDWARVLGIPARDLFPDLARFRPDGWAVEGDGHPSPDAHDRIAVVMVRELERQGLVTQNP